MLLSKGKNYSVSFCMLKSRGAGEDRGPRYSYLGGVKIIGGCNNA